LGVPRPCEGSHPTAEPSGPAAIVPQHLVLVLPSTGEVDSRSYRIASALIARGYRVTMLARWKAGLPLQEDDPNGYRIIRVVASTADGLPLPGPRRLVGRLLRRRRRPPPAAREHS